MTKSAIIVNVLLIFKYNRDIETSVIFLDFFHNSLCHPVLRLQTVIQLKKS